MLWFSINASWGIIVQIQGMKLTEVGKIVTLINCVTFLNWIQHDNFKAVFRIRIHWIHNILISWIQIRKNILILIQGAKYQQN